MSRGVSTAIKVLLAAGVLWVLSRMVPLAEVQDAILSSNVGLLISGAMLLPIQLLFRIVRWRVLVLRSGERIPFRTAARTVLIGYAFSATTPGEVGDYISRARLNATSSPQRTVALTIVEKLLHLLFVLLLGIPAIITIHVHSVIAGGVSIVAGFALMFAAALFRRRLLGLTAVRTLARRFGFDAGLDLLLGLSARSLWPVAVMTLLVLLVVVVQEYLFLNAVARADVVQTWLGYWSGLSVRVAAPFFIGDLGIREATHVYFFGLLGIPAAPAISASLLMFAINTFLPSVVGLIAFLAHRVQRS